MCAKEQRVFQYQNECYNGTVWECPKKQGVSQGARSVPISNISRYNGTVPVWSMCAKEQFCGEVVEFAATLAQQKDRTLKNAHFDASPTRQNSSIVESAFLC